MRRVLVLGLVSAFAGAGFAAEAGAAKRKKCPPGKTLVGKRCIKRCPHGQKLVKNRVHKRVTGRCVRVKKPQRTPTPTPTPPSTPTPAPPPTPTPPDDQSGGLAGKTLSVTLGNGSALSVAISADGQNAVYRVSITCTAADAGHTQLTLTNGDAGESLLFRTKGRDLTSKADGSFTDPATGALLTWRFEHAERMGDTLRGRLFGHISKPAPGGGTLECGDTALVVLR